MNQLNMNKSTWTNQGLYSNLLWGASGARYDLDCTYEERWSSTKQDEPKSMTCVPSVPRQKDCSSFGEMTSATLWHHHLEKNSALDTTSVDHSRQGVIFRMPWLHICCTTWSECSPQCSEIWKCRVTLRNWDSCRLQVTMNESQRMNILQSSQNLSGPLAKWKLWKCKQLVQRVIKTAGAYKMIEMHGDLPHSMQVLMNASTSDLLFPTVYYANSSNVAHVYDLAQ